MLEATALERYLQFLLRDVLRLGRVGERRTQRAERQIRALRHEHDLAARRHLDGSGPPRPQPGNGAEQRALAAAGFADDQDLLALADDGGGLADDDAAIG